MSNESKNPQKLRDVEMRACEAAEDPLRRTMEAARTNGDHLQDAEARHLTSWMANKGPEPEDNEPDSKA